MRIRIERSFVALTIGATSAEMAWPALVASLGDLGHVALVAWMAIAVALALRFLPPRLDGLLRRHRALSVAWAVLALLTVVQTARLSRHVVDPSCDWWHTTKQEFWSRHSCMGAYFYAADLNRQGEDNVYDEKLYPVLNPDADNRASLEFLQPDDPYQYPPQFLLLPRLAMALSNDYHIIQAYWYTVQALLFAVALFLLARWTGGAAGSVALWLIPLVWISVPSLLNFQYGQFHVTTIVLAMTAFVAFERRRHAVGGALLASAILAKGFPGILFLPLLLTRRWRDLAWTAASLLTLTGLAWMVLGSTPFSAFVHYHLPRLSSGAAFAFDEVWPEWKGWLLAGNVSPFAFVRKSAELGLLPASAGLARTVHSLFVGALFLGACFTSWEGTPRRRALLWMAFLNLAAFTSPAAWGDYITVGTLWMLTFLLVGSARQHWIVAGLLAFCSLLPGIVAIGNFPSPNVAMALSLVGTLLLLGTNLWVIAPHVRPLPSLNRSAAVHRRESEA